MFSENERKIFVYFDGERELRGDPFAITRRLVRWLDGDPDRVLADRWAGYPEEEVDEFGAPLPLDPAKIDKALEPVRFEAEQKIIKATQEAFGLAPYDPETGLGVGEEQLLQLFDEFCVWSEGQKKSTASPQTYSPLTQGQPASLTLKSSMVSG